MFMYKDTFSKRILMTVKKVSDVLFLAHFFRTTDIKKYKYASLHAGIRVFFQIIPKNDDLSERFISLLLCAIINHSENTLFIGTIWVKAWKTLEKPGQDKNKGKALYITIR